MIVMGNLSAVVEKRLILGFQVNSAGMLARLFPQDGKQLLIACVDVN